MADTQAEYEKQRIDNLNARIGEIHRLSGAIERAARVGAPLPITKETLRKLSMATRECASVVNEHAIGNKFSDATLRAVATGLFEINDIINNLILYAAMMH